MIQIQKVNDHKICGTIVWLGEETWHVSEVSGVEYATRKIRVEKTPGSKYDESAYFDLRGDMVRAKWQVGDVVEAFFSIYAYENKYGKKGTCLVCRDIKKKTSDDGCDVNI